MEDKCKMLKIAVWNWNKCIGNISSLKDNVSLLNKYNIIVYCTLNCFPISCYQYWYKKKAKNIDMKKLFETKQS